MGQRQSPQGQRFPAQFPIPPEGQQQSTKPPVLKMHVDKGKVTAEILNCPVQSVLSELADRTGIIFEVRSHENPQISLSLQEVPLQEAIQRIASGKNAVFLYSDDGAGAEQITMVRIFGRTSETVQPGIVYLGTGKVTKSGDILDTPEHALKTLAESTDTGEKENAIEVLAAAGASEAIIQALIKAASDPAPEVRSAAIDALAALNARSALPTVLQRLKDTHPGVRQVAAAAIGVLGSAENLKHLRPVVADKDPGVAAAAESAMRKLARLK